MPATADSTSAASPTTSHAARPPISARTPERNRAWSSTRNTGRWRFTHVGLLATVGPRRRGTRSSTSVPRPGAVVMATRPPWRVDAAPDRVGDAVAVGGHGGEVEPRAAVADVDGDLAGRRPRRRPTPRSTPACLAALTVASRAAGTQGGGRVVDGAVAHHDHVDGDRVVGLDVAGHGGERGRPSVGPAGRPARPGRRRATPAARAPGGGPGCTTSCGRCWAAPRWMRASVCSTESCRWAATSARSSERMRSRRSRSRSPSRRRSHGPNTSAVPPTARPRATSTVTAPSPVSPPVT